MIAKMPFHNSIIPVKLTIVIFFLFKKAACGRIENKKKEKIKNIKWNLGYNSQVLRLTTTSTN